MIAVHAAPLFYSSSDDPLRILLLCKEMQLILSFFSIPLIILLTYGCSFCWFVCGFVDLNAQDSQGMTPVHEAAYRGHSKLYQYLAGLTVVDLTIKVDKLTINVGSFF